MSNKVYVDVLAEFTTDGILIPRSLRWKDGTVYEIQSSHVYICHTSLLYLEVQPQNHLRTYDSSSSASYIVCSVSQSHLYYSYYS